MTSGFTPGRLCASLALAAASLALQADEHTQLFISNPTATVQVLRSTPPAEAGALTVRTTAADGTVAVQERMPDGTAEVIPIPAHGTVVIDRSQACGTVWRKFSCAPADGSGSPSRVWYRSQGEGDRRTHVRDDESGPRKVDEGNLVFPEPSWFDYLGGAGCTIL